MFKAIALGLRLRSATTAQLELINAKAYARLRALQRVHYDKDWQYQDGSIAFGIVAYDCDFGNEQDWLTLLSMVQEHGPIDNEDLANPIDAPKRYRYEGWRFTYPPTCNVKYFCGMHPQARVIDLGAISA